MRGTHGHHAFTLIEMIAALVVLSTIAMTATLVIGRIATNFHDRSVQEMLHLEASVTLNRIVRELRQIPGRSDESGLVMPSLDSATESSIEWDGSRSIGLRENRVLLNSDGSNADVLATDVRSLAFEYLDDQHRLISNSGIVAADELPNVQRIRIRLTLARQGCEHSLQSLVFLRSTISNAIANGGG